MAISPLESHFPEIISEVSGFAIFMIDPNRTILTWNQGCELMKGYTPQEAIGESFDMLFPDFLREEGFPQKEVRKAGESGRYETENWRRKKNGDLFWACVLLTRITNEQGEVIGYVKITQDHTHRKRFEDELNSKIKDTENINRELLSANYNLEQFAYASSHDLQAPLRKIRVFVNRLKEKLEGKADHSEMELLQRIENSTGRLAKLTGDLLSYSNVTHGSGPLTDTPLTEVVKGVLDDLELDISEKQAVISLQNLPIVKGNTRQFQQLFQNLISNAIKYAKPSVQPIIELTSREVSGSEAKALLDKVEQEKKYFLIEVTDNGIGFAADYAEEIFKVFTRLHNLAEYPGTGIGLSIAKKVVHNHDGHIWAESKPGAGASFRILLPIA